MRVPRWIFYALAYLIASLAGMAARGDSLVDELALVPLPPVSDDPLELSGWVAGGMRADAVNSPVESLETCDSWDWLRSSDPEFDCFISPMTNPIYFEDPRTLSEVRVIVMSQQLPQRGALAGGGFQWLGVQGRAALTDRCSVVMAKSGFLMAGAPTPIDDGWTDLALGLKYNLVNDPIDQWMVSAGFHYELPVGSTRTWQGNGDGQFHLYLTGAAAVLDYSHVMSAIGWRVPTDPAAENQIVYWSNHWDTRIWSGGLYFLAEANWYHYASNGRAMAADFGGIDLFNVGSDNVAGHDIVTGAVGLKLKRRPNRELGLVYEVPLTDRRDLLDDRLTIDLIFRR